MMVLRSQQTHDVVGSISEGWGRGLLRPMARSALCDERVPGKERSVFHPGESLLLVYGRQFQPHSPFPEERDGNLWKDQAYFNH